MITVTLPNLRLGLWDLRDQTTLGVSDLSSYISIPNASQIALQITPPGYPTINVAFTPGNVNVYKCSDLGITCGITECCPLPDGIYDVQYTVLPIGQQQSASIEKTFIKIDQILCKFQNMFSKIDVDCNCGDDKQKELKKILKGVDLMINGSVTAANLCDPLGSYTLYRKADDILNGMCCQFNMDCMSPFSCPSCQ